MNPLNTSKKKMILSVILAAAMPLLVVLSAVLYCALDTSWYMKTFEEQTTAKALGISEEDLGSVTQTLTAYLAGQEQDLQVYVVQEGLEIPFYNEKELKHMVDVQVLLNGVIWARRMVFFMSLGAFVLLWRWGGTKAVYRGILASAIGGLVLASFIGLMAAVDFSEAFYRFHQIFFTNDLWLLDPATDRLIVLVPEPFFTAITYRIVTLSAGIVSLLLLIGGLGTAITWKQRGV